jgi:hypothetical protein
MSWQHGAAVPCMGVVAVLPNRDLAAGALGTLATIKNAIRWPGMPGHFRG